MPRKILTIILSFLIIMFTIIIFVPDNKEIPTKDQERILLTFPQSNKEKIEKGELDEWQQAVINEYDFAMFYLIKKYPSYALEITSCSSQNFNHKGYSIYFFHEFNKEENYVLYLTGNNDSNFKAKDDFYSHLFKDELEDEILDLFPDDLQKITNISINMTNLLGEEINEKSSTNAFLNGRVNANINGIITLKSYIHYKSWYEKTTSDIAAIIQNNNINGNFIIKFFNNSNKLIYEAKFSGTGSKIDFQKYYG